MSSVLNDLMRQLDAIENESRGPEIEGVDAFSDAPEDLRKALKTGFEMPPGKTPLTAHGFKWPAGLDEPIDRKIMMNLALASRSTNPTAEAIRAELKRCPVAMARVNGVTNQ